jgi:hypothetical protein
VGYLLYITRADDWLDATKKPIAANEWMAIVEADPTLSVNTNDYADYRVEDGGIQRAHPVEWSEADDGNCFWYRDGAVHCKNPSAVWQRKMIELAKRLHAKVLGEENEEYT